MSLLTRKNGSGAAGALGRGRQQSSEAAPPAKTAGVVIKQRADEAAAIAVPLAKNAGVVIRQRADGAAAIAVPLAKNAGVVLKQRADEAAAKAVPLAKNAGVVVKQRADDAAAWAAPHVNDARAWAAPRVEQAGVAVEAKIAPQVSDMLTKAARQLDPVPKAPEKRSHARLAGGIALLAAVASALAAAALVRKRLRSADNAEPDEAAAADAPGTAGQPDAAADADASQAEVNGQVRTRTP